MAEKRKPGRPSFKPTEEQREKVRQMAAVGIPYEQIARVVKKGGIAVETLRKYFDEELHTSAIEANTQVAGSMFQRAINGDVQAQKWWSACRMGWKETSKYELTGEDGGPVKVTQVIISAPDDDGKS